MNFTPDPAETAFRRKVRSFIEANLPEDLARRGRRHYTATREEMMRWQGILFQHGYAQPHWPVERGGRGWTGRQRMIFEQELAAAHAPATNVQGLTLFGPVLNEFGTPAQQRRFREPLLSGKVIWCQGFSEPGAGSDLASLRTRAVRNGEQWLINGQKTWTTQANLSDWVFLLARTSAARRKQDGISFFLVDMQTPGIAVRPIITIDGQHHLNETFFEDVAVPQENLVGAEGQGWAIAKFLLNNERIFGSADMPVLYLSLARARSLLLLQKGDAGRLMEDSKFSAPLARCEFEIAAIEMKLLEMVSRDSITERDLSIVGSSLKVRATEVYMALTELALNALGDDGAIAVPDPEGGAVHPHSVPEELEGIATAFLYSRAAAIYGGTNEIQRNIIAKARFGF